jgi:hypothetical protein
MKFISSSSRPAVAEAVGWARSAPCRRRASRRMRSATHAGHRRWTGYRRRKASGSFLPPLPVMWVRYPIKCSNIDEHDGVEVEASNRVNASGKSRSSGAPSGSTRWSRASPRPVRARPATACCSDPQHREQRVQGRRQLGGGHIGAGTCAIGSTPVARSSAIDHASRSSTRWPAAAKS